MLLKYLIHVNNTANSSYPQLYNQFNEKYLEKNVDYILTEDEFMLLCTDLSSRNLVEFSTKIEDFNKVYQVLPSLAVEGPNDNRPTIRVTDIGKELINFIEDSLNLY